MRKCIISAVLIGFSSFSAFAQSSDLFECPPVSEIVKDPIKLNWSANTTEGLWKSYKISFASRLTHFTGAQWVGENIGQIFCVYNSEQVLTIQGQNQTQATLPVILVFGTLSPVPSGYQWKHTQRGVRFCASDERSDCPFAVNQKHVTTDIYQEVSGLKGM